MNNRDAIARAMEALEQRGRFTITGNKAKAKTLKTAQEDADADAAAWNALNYLRTII